MLSAAFKHGKHLGSIFLLENKFPKEELCFCSDFHADTVAKFASFPSTSWADVQTPGFCMSRVSSSLRWTSFFLFLAISAFFSFSTVMRCCWISTCLFLYSSWGAGNDFRAAARIPGHSRAFFVERRVAVLLLLNITMSSAPELLFKHKVSLEVTDLTVQRHTRLLHSCWRQTSLDPAAPLMGYSISHRAKWSSGMRETYWA